MPIYEYQCGRCGKEFELFKSVKDSAEPACKYCGGPVRKLISRSSFHLKGSGWYVTDYARKGSSASEKEKTASSTSSGPSKDDSASTPKTESSSTVKSPD
ncbi:MAG: zinc ribbon domain-containing protein [bacterium]